MNDALIKKLKEHIKKELKKKYTPKEIETALLRAGFDKTSVRQAFTELKIKQPSFMEGLFASKPSKKKKLETKKPVKEKKVEKPKKPEIKKPAKKKKSFFSTLFKKKTVKAKPKKLEIKKPAVKKVEIKKKHKPIKISFFAKLITTLLLIIIIMAAIILLFSPKSCATKECFLEKANACQRATYKNSIAGAQLNYEIKTDCTLVKTLVKVADNEPDEIKEKFEGKSMVCAYYQDDFSPMHIETLSGLIVDCEGPLKKELLNYVT